MPDAVTWSVPQLVDWVNAVVAQTLGGEIWVEGEITNLQRSSVGHVYFTLRDPDGDPRQGATLAVTLFEWHRQNVNRHLKRTGGNVRISDGVRVRIRGSVEVYGPRSQLQLRMSGIDPVFTMGTMFAERARLLAALEAEGLLGANRLTVLPRLVERVAVVTSLGSAAHADALHELTAGGRGVELVVIDTRVQGADAPEGIVAGLRTAVRRGADLVLLVRGGGARTDLAAFDHEVVARAIATSPVPVWTGIGHEIDRTVADDVAHTAWKTPTACAAAVVDHLTAAADACDEVWEALLDAAGRGLERSGARLDRVAARLQRAATGDLDDAGARLATASHRARRAADAHLIRQSGRIERALDRARAAAPARLTEAERRIDAVAATTRAYDPAAALARGWSITRGPDGRAVRAADVAPGTVLTTVVADGEITSTVTSADGTSLGAR